MIILIGAQKGGCGKSTVAVNLAAAFARLGRDVMLVDADRQGSSSNWITDRNANQELKKVHSVKQYNDVRETVLDLAERYEIVLIDAAGRDSAELRSGMLCADLLIMPVRPSQFDLDTVPRMQEIYKESLLINPGVKFHAVISMGPTNPIIHETKDAQDYFKDCPEIKLFNTIIRDRKVYRDSVFGGIGRGVVEMNNSKAKQEIDNLSSEVLKAYGGI